MKAKLQNIINSSMVLFNREGYQAPTIDKITEASGVSKMTFYRYFPDKESLIITVLEKKRAQFINELKEITEAESEIKNKLFAIFRYYNSWFYTPEFNGCMFNRAVVEFGDGSPVLKEINLKFRADLQALIYEILCRCLNPEPANRVSFTIMMLIDGAIAASQSEGIANIENSPALTAWSTTKALIFSEGGTV
ncbi:TetR/AcrR family transcriptional regulator [Erwinia psidii]|uniref:TetR/AcrR family transcriptional regulator n=1 Tax=Erwinia psidii TaxID=69224 RepID=A0A3N6V365_9GAMM|nr:TetR/AcrR family transcriptional regulator [Erwinia psidii]MCX8957649.1 TetR/AcrR family transcriptional regulator [Erwinia psidii]MCX8960703.1 TetR/AcrR family transcriptional regulator [Erwinia psidii]MCX8964052.1 TetR/AcrR family transcriptional regulator [Erwinia psidii]RQM39535.1 TetR/AcrR family transcriptional regulator [Erwinia psidii]